MSKKAETGYKIGYKVVYIKHDKKMSCIVFDGPGKVEYSTGKYVGPNKGCGPLCVFTKLQTALKFAGVFDSVYRCKYYPSTHEFVWTPQRGDILPLSGMGEYSALASKVKLTRRIA